ncbi:MAG: winged helix-turn-helix transcriptional regulator [Candidatus Bathyarchaeota archaeon]|nr:winged helix-turn-helix transcriptional regulator [Candidatus Bathyarchaeota archaeon]MDH5746726.1 winged helix-turn-helix transcriptional regulator [Candidatus Bathyarchaeota archaeon]
MREIEWKLLSELMKNSRKSDRELAKVIGSSQPTVTRARTKLEREGYIKEYTMIPDFAKLGYQIMALTFVKTELGFTKEAIEKTRNAIRKRIRDTPMDLVMLERGKGMKYDGVVISLHKTYECFNKLRDRLKQYPFVQYDTDSFLISLHDENRYLPLTLRMLADHFSKTTEKEEKR